MFPSIFVLLDKIYDKVIDKKWSLLNGNIGLYNGAMGTSLFLYHFGSSNENREFALDEADDFLRHVVEKSHEIDNDSFSSGLFGVGWGIDYLINQEYVTASSDILADVDHILMKHNVRNAGAGLANGTMGYAYYFASRYSKIFLPGDNFYEMLYHYEKCGAMIQFISRLEITIEDLLLKWKGQRPGDFDNFFFYNKKFLTEFVPELVSAYYFFSDLMKFELYPQVIINILNQIKSKVVVSLDWCLDRFDHAKLKKYGNENQLFDMILMLLCVASDFLDSTHFFARLLECEKRILPALISDSEQGKYSSNIIIQTLGRLHHQTSGRAFGEVAVRLAESQFYHLQNSSDIAAWGLRDGISGLGLVMLGLEDKDTLIWDRCIGLS